MIPLFDEVAFFFDLRHRNRCARFVSIELADVFRVDQIDFIKQINRDDEESDSALTDDFFKMVDLLRSDVIQRQGSL